MEENICDFKNWKLVSEKIFVNDKSVLCFHAKAKTSARKCSQMASKM